MSEPTNQTGMTTTQAAPAARVPVTMGMAPTSFDEGWRMAQALSKGGEMLPKQYRDNPGAILIALQMGAELGLAPMQALSSLAVIGGRASLWGDALLALVINAPVYQEHDEYFEVEVSRTLNDATHDKPSRGIVLDRVMERREGLTAADLKVDSTVAVCTFVRLGKPTPVTRRFSVGQARKAGYLPSEANKGGKDGPWQTHPDRMLQMRARGFAARDAFPDVLRGIHTTEELRDVPLVEDESAAPLRMVHRLSEQVIDPVPVTPTDGGGAVSPAPSSPPADTLGPVGVLRVDRLIGGPCAFLADGTQVWLANDDDLKEVEKFIGTSHKLVFAVVPVDGVPQQKTAVSFSIAE
jgi:hypothetical protein